MPVKYDREKLEREYMEGEKTLYALAKSQNIPYSTVKRYARQYGWRSNNASKRFIDMSKELRIADKLCDILKSALNDERQFQRYIIKNRDGTDELILKKVDMHAVSDAVRALKTIEGIKRSISVRAQVGEDTATLDEAGQIEIPEVNEGGNDE